jgi:uncharacterized protein with GYD domain
MAKYLIIAAYTAEGAKGLLKDSGTKRRQAAEQAIKSAGGTMEAFYFAFGDDDAYVIVDAPDHASIAAASLAINAMRGRDERSHCSRPRSIRRLRDESRFIGTCYPANQYTSSGARAHGPQDECPCRVSGAAGSAEGLRPLGGEFVPLQFCSNRSVSHPSILNLHRGSRGSRPTSSGGSRQVRTASGSVPQCGSPENCRDPEHVWLVLSLSVLRSHLALRWRQAARS